MALTYKLSVPLVGTMNKIVSYLQEMNITASGEFVQDIPRHCIITLEVSNGITPNEAFELGALVNALENLYNK